jgi:carboxyl-terminal processing protease
MDHVTLVGQPTRGASGNPRPVTLSNGVRVWFSRWISLTPEGTPLEGRGIRPDVLVEHEGNGDKTFDKAVEILKKQSE